MIDVTRRDDMDRNARKHVCGDLQPALTERSMGTNWSFRIYGCHKQTIKLRIRLPQCSGLFVFSLAAYVQWLVFSRWQIFFLQYLQLKSKAKLKDHDHKWQPSQATIKRVKWSWREGNCQKHNNMQTLFRDLQSCEAWMLFVTYL